MEIECLQTGPLKANTFFVPLAGRAVLIVDPAACSFSGDEKSIEDFLFEHQLVPVGVLFTHGHFDHVSGLKELRNSFPKIPVAIHKEDAECLGKNSAKIHKSDLAAVDFFSEEFLQELSDLPAADFFLLEGDTLEKYFCAEHIISAFAGQDAPDVEAVLNSLSHWQVLHTPGHSPGSVCFLNESENVLISGDTVFFQSYGRTDLRGGSEAKIQKSLVRIFSELDLKTKVFPGHGAFGFELGMNE